MTSLNDGIMKRGKTWSYVIRVSDPVTGKSKPKWVGGFSTAKAAKSARDEARSAARRGEYVEKSRITVQEYLTEWLDGHAMEIKPSTREGYREWLTRYVYPRIGEMRLQAVRSATLTKLYLDLSDSGSQSGGPLSARSVDYVHAILRKAFNDAVRADNLLPSNPCLAAKRPRREGGTPPGTIWDAEQLRTFLGVAGGHRLFAFFRLSVYSGARRGELLFLRWADVDWRTPAIHIRGTAGMVGGKRTEGTTKSGRERIVPLDRLTMRILRRHQRHQMADRLTARESWEDHGYVFTTGSWSAGAA